VIDPAGVERLLTDHECARTDGGDRIWSLLNLELWYRTFIDQDGVQSLPDSARSQAFTAGEFSRSG